MLVVISDLLDDVDDILRGLRSLRGRGHDLLVLHVMDDDELDFPFSGPAQFYGLEGEDSLNCNPRSLRDGYLRMLDEYLDRLRHGCATDGVEYALIRTSDPFDAALLTLLKRRMGRLKHRPAMPSGA